MFFFCIYSFKNSLKAAKFLNLLVSNLFCYRLDILEKLIYKVWAKLKNLAPHSSTNWIGGHKI